jgi:hypothetical protein
MSLQSLRPALARVRYARTPRQVLVGAEGAALASGSLPPAPPRGTHARTWRSLPGVRLDAIARPRAHIAALARRNAQLARRLAALQAEIASVVSRLRFVPQTPVEIVAAPEPGFPAQGRESTTREAHPFANAPPVPPEPSQPHRFRESVSTAAGAASF